MTIFPENSPLDCSKTFYDSDGVIESPSYPAVYPNSRKCTWTISSPEGSTINLEFEHFDIEYHPQCSWDSMSVSIDEAFFCSEGRNFPCEGTFNSFCPIFSKRNVSTAVADPVAG